MNSTFCTWRRVKHRKWIGFLVACVLVATSMFSCTVQKSPVTGKKRAYGYSWEKELEIGREADKSIQQQYGIYEDSSLVNYVKRVGHKVLKESHMRRPSTSEKYRETEFTFRVLDSPVVNAFALPGGYVYVTRGLLAHLNNEAQLAVVLGHEIGHVAARHASQRAFEQKAGQIALVGGAVVGQEVFGVPGQDLLELGGTATQLLFLRYSRDDERESDQLGVEYAAMAGYKASEGAEFFTSLRRLSDQSGQSLPSLLSTHPDPGDREEKIPKLAEQWGEKGYKMNAVKKEKYMNKLDGLVYDDDPREGFVRDGIFYHPELAFQFTVPSEWEVRNQRNSVILIEPKEQAVMQFVIDPEAESSRSSVNNVLSKQGINLIEQGEAPNTGKLEAHYATATAETGQGTVKLYLYAVSYKKNVYRYLGYSSPDSFSKYQPAFQEASEQFEPLTDSGILAIKPVKLDIFPARKSAVFSDMLPDKLPMDIQADRIAIINQVDLNSDIAKGSLIKIPVQ